VKNTAQEKCGTLKLIKDVSLALNLSGVFGPVNSPKGLEMQDKHLILKVNNRKNRFI
jgi:hypothetical protein